MKGPQKKLIPILWLAWIFAGVSTALGVVETKEKISIVQHDHIVVEVNGVEVKIPSGGTLQVVAGDMIKMKSAKFADQTIASNVLSFRSYWHGNGDGYSEHHGPLIRTDADLKKKSSQEDREETHFIIAKCKSGELGRVRVEIIPPKLDWIIMEINGGKQVLKEGEKLRLTKRDKIKLIDVKTNVRVLGDDITLNLVPTADNSYEMQLKRKAAIFARIGVVLSDK